MDVSIHKNQSVNHAQPSTLPEVQSHSSSGTQPGADPIKVEKKSTEPASLSSTDQQQEDLSLLSSALEETSVSHLQSKARGDHCIDVVALGEGLQFLEPAQLKLLSPTQIGQISEAQWQLLSLPQLNALVTDAREHNLKVSHDLGGEKVKLYHEPSTSTAPVPYHEVQEGGLCAQHALNNLLGGHQLTREQLTRIGAQAALEQGMGAEVLPQLLAYVQARNLSVKEEDLFSLLENNELMAAFRRDMAEKLPSDLNPFHTLDGTDPGVVQKALQSIGVDSDYAKVSELVQASGKDKHQALEEAVAHTDGFMIAGYDGDIRQLPFPGLGALARDHFVAVRKVEGQWWIVDSMNQKQVNLPLSVLRDNFRLIIPKAPLPTAPILKPVDTPAPEPSPPVGKTKTQPPIASSSVRRERRDYGISGAHPLWIAAESSYLTLESSAQLVGHLQAHIDRAQNKLSKALFKGLALTQTRNHIAQVVARMAPDGPTAWSLRLRTDDELRTLLAEGFAKGKTYAQLTQNQQKLVEALLKGIRDGLRKTAHDEDVVARTQVLQTRQAAFAHIDLQRRQQYSHVMADIRGRSPVTLSQKTVDDLEAKAGLEITEARQAIRVDTARLRQETTYADLGLRQSSLLSQAERLDAYTQMLDLSSPRRLISPQQWLQSLSLPEQERCAWTFATLTPRQMLADIKRQQSLGGFQKQFVRGTLQQLHEESLDWLNRLQQSQVTDRQTTNACPETLTFRGLDYRLQKQLGQGAFGAAYLFVGPNGEAIVVKRLLDSLDVNGDFEQMSSDVRMHREAMGPDQSGHPHILGLKGVIYSPSSRLGQGELLAVMEVAGGGDLTRLGNTLRGYLVDGLISPSVAQKLQRLMIGQVAQGLRYLHKERQMLHSDLKPDNILINSEGQIKIADFGMAQEGLILNHAGGTPMFQAPEILTDQGGDEHSDTWAVGMMLRGFLTGEYVFPHHTQVYAAAGYFHRPADEFMKQGREVYEPGKSTVEIDTDTGKQLVTLQALGGLEQMVNALLHPDPKKRPNLEAVLNHHLFNDPDLNDPQLQALVKAIVSGDKDKVKELNKALS